MRYVYLTFAFLVVMVLAVAGFRGSLFTKPPIEIFSDMDRQQKFKPQSPSNFFADGRADRQPPAHVVARGVGYATQPGLPVYTGGNTAYHTGKDASGAYVRGFPQPFVVSAEAMARGKERYGIYCAVCHGPLGDGNGVTKQVGWAAIANLVQPPISEHAEGDLFDVITNGRKTMYPYGDKLTPEDRWAVVLYVRALQRAANGRAEDLPEGVRKELGL